MRDQYKVLAEKYAVVKESTPEETEEERAGGLFSSELRDLFKKYPDRYDFMRWLIANLPLERLPSNSKGEPYPLPSYTRNTYGVSDWLDDNVRVYKVTHNMLSPISWDIQMEIEQNVLDDKYKKFQVYKQHLNKDNPGVPPEY